MASRRNHTPEQIVRKLQGADRLIAEGQDVAGVCRALQVTEATHYRWRNQYGGLKAEDVRRLKELEKMWSRLWKASPLTAIGELLPAHPGTSRQRCR